MTTLAQEIQDLKTKIFAQAPPAFMKTFGDWMDELSDTGIDEQHRKPGEQAPEFTLPDAEGKLVSLKELRSAGPVVVTFYRGAWCPFCNLALRAYQQILPQIKELGATFVAISPQTPDSSLTMAQKHELEYPVLSDSGNAVARQYGIVYRLGSAMYELQTQFGVDLSFYNGDDSRELPLPGTFIIDKTGTIRFAQVFVNHSDRLEPEAILATLHTL